MAQTKPMQSETEILEQIRELVSKCLKSNRKDLNLRDLLKLSAESFYQRMQDSGCVSENTKKNVCYDDIMQQYIAGMACQKTIEELEDYLNKFLCVLEKLEGPIAKAGEVLRIALNKSVCDDFPEVKFLSIKKHDELVVPSGSSGQALQPETLGQVDRGPSDSSQYPLQQAVQPVPTTGNGPRSLIVATHTIRTGRDELDSGKGQSMVSDHEVKENDTEQHCDREVVRKDQDSSKGHIHDDSEIGSQETKTLQGSERETQEPQTTNEIYRRTNTTVISGTPQGKCTEPHQQTTDLTPVKKCVSPKRYSVVNLDVKFNIGDINLHCPPTESLRLFLGIIVILVVFIFIFDILLNMYVYNYNNMCGM